MFTARLSRIITTIVLAALSTLPAPADVKMKTRMTVAGHSFDSTVLIKGARERREMNVGPGFTSVTIYQCDLKRMVILNPMSKTYTVVDLQETEDQAVAAAKAGEAPASRASRPARSGGGVVTVSMNSTPTGEEKKMLGYTARRIKTDMTTDASAGACSGPKSATIHMDGWYADIPGYMACSSSGKAAMSMRPQQQECKDEVHFKGKVSRLGFPLVQDTSFTGEGGQSMTMRQETLDISTASLDQALFEIPSDYREGSGMGPRGGVAPGAGSGQAPGGMSPEQMREMMRQAAANGEVSEEQMARAQQAIEMARAARGTRAGAAAEEAASAQRSGRVRIGIVRIDDHSGQNLSTDSMRSRLMEEFNGLDAEAVALNVSSSDSREIAAQAARGQACDYILYADMSGKAPSAKKKFGSLIGAGSSPTFEGTVKYRLYATNDAAAHLDSSASSTDGSSMEESVGATLPKVAEAVMQQVKQDHMSRPHR